MQLLAVIAVIGTLCLTVQAQNISIDALENVESFIAQNERQYEAHIQALELQSDAYRVSYKRQVNAISVHATLIEAKQVELEERLNPLELLNRNCVQLYRAQLITIASVKAKMSACIVNGNSPMENYLSSCNSYVRNMRSYLTNQHKTGLSNCQKNNLQSASNYTICVTQVIASTNSVFTNYQKGYNQNLEVAECSADSRIKLAWDCSFTALYESIYKIGEVSRLIDDCIAGINICPTCPATTGCSNVIDLNLKDSDFRNATINNPFYGLTRNLDCLQLNLK